MKFGLMFAYQNPPQGNIPWQEPYSDMISCLPRAETLGYASVFQASHHAQKDGFCPSPLIAMAGAAAVTENMRIGTSVLLVPLYAPMKLAEDIAVLDNLSGGRFIFGVAPGYVSSEFSAHNIPREERISRFEESLDFMTAAWSGQKFSFNGKHFDVSNALLTPPPIQLPSPPIWYGVSAPSSLRRAVKRRAVQIMSPRHGIKELKEHYKVYDTAAAEVGWQPPDRPIIRQVFIANTKARAEELAAPAVDYLYRELYGAASAAGDRVLRGDDGNIVTQTDSVVFDGFKQRYIVGDPDFAIQEIEKYRTELNPSEMICWMHMPGILGGDAANSMELFAKEVMPAFL